MNEVSQGKSEQEEEKKEEEEEEDNAPAHLHDLLSALLKHLLSYCNTHAHDQPVVSISIVLNVID